VTLEASLGGRKRQMQVIARSLVSKPKLLLVDEMSLKFNVPTSR